jgi:chorismate mutase
MNASNRGLKALRGATQLPADDQVAMDELVPELLVQMLDQNGLTVGSVISAILTATPDLISAFPAASARRAGWDDVPMLCAQEIAVKGAMPRVVRVLLHVEGLVSEQARHVYLRGTEALRSD